MSSSTSSARSAKPLCQEKGFTLVELMITVMIVSILAAVAVPQYNAYVRRTHRAAAQAALQEASHWLQRAMTANGFYPAAGAFATSLQDVEGGRYTITYVPAAAPAATYVLTATPGAIQASDECGTFTLNERGQRTVSGSLTVAECWTH